LTAHYLWGPFIYGELSSLADEHCNVTTYEDGEAFATPFFAISLY